VRASVRERVPRLDRDRYLAPDISAAAGSCAPARLPPPWGSSCLPSMAQRNDLVSPLPAIEYWMMPLQLLGD